METEKVTLRVCDYPVCPSVEIQGKNVAKKAFWLMVAYFIFKPSSKKKALGKKK